MQYHNGYLYIAAGEGEDRSIPNTDFYRFNLATSQWEDISHASTYVGVSQTGSVIYQDHFYLFFGWIRLQDDDSSKIFRASLNSDFAWTEVADFPSIKCDSMTVSIKDSTTYLFGGYSTDGPSNNLIAFDMSKDPIEFTTTQTVNTPSLRVSHSIEPIYGHLYLFGGLSEGESLNDLWSFDISNLNWNSIEFTGNPPSSRLSHGSASLGDSLIIWGGENESGYLNDMFKYSVNTNSWEELVSVSALVPTPRSSMCVVLYDTDLYLYGGITETGLSSELWRYRIGLQEYELLDLNNKNGPSAIKKHKCSIEDTDEGLLLYVMYGTGFAERPMGMVHYYNIDTRTWTKVHESQKKRNAAVVHKINDKVLIAGGESWGLRMLTDIFIIDLSSCEEQTCSEIEIGDLSEHYANGGSAYYLNYIFIHSGSNPLNDIIRSNVPKNSFYRIDLSTYLGCSLGSEEINSKCEFCRKGYYREAYNSDCVPCQTGFFNNYIGSSVFKQCFPCPEGSYNPYEGASYCLQCPVHSFCPIGSSNFTYEIVGLEEHSFQPEFYEYRTKEASDMSLLLIVFVAFLGFAIIVLFLFWKRLHRILASLDMFSSLHTFEIGNAITLTKNKIGGAFSIIFYIAALIVVVSTIPSYAIDNLIETKALVPYIILDSDYDFYTEAIVSIDFDGYYAPCAISSNQCDPSIVFTPKNIFHRGDISLKCIRSKDNCILELECRECGISSSSSLEFELSSPNSYSSKITVNVTTFSSIPNKYSSVYYSISSDTGKVFRGSPASTFYFSMAASVYKNSISGEESTGYHTMISSQPEPGAQYSTLEIPFTSSLLVNLELSRSENSLMTLHDEKNPLLILLFTLLGSISGVLGAIGAAMASFERYYTKINTSINNKKNEKELFELRNKYKIFLNQRGKIDLPSEEDPDVTASNRTHSVLKRNFHPVESRIDEF